MRGRPLLVSGIGKRNALLRLLKTECVAYAMDVIGCDAVSFPPAGVEVDHFEPLPLATSNDFKGHLAGVLKQHDVGAYLSLIDPEIPLLGEIERDGACSESVLLHPAVETSALCEDKYAFYAFLASHDLPGIPTLLTPPDNFPFIRKDRRGSAASGFHIFRHADDLAVHREQNSVPYYVYQPFCVGTHFCVDAYYALANGGLVDCCVKEVLSKKNGESYFLRAVAREPVLALLRQIGDVLPLRGIVNLDIYLEDRQWKIMEINCRIGGNYPASHAFGCNLLAHALAELHGGSGTGTYCPSDYEVGAYISKYFAFTETYAISAGHGIPHISDCPIRQQYPSRLHSEWTERRSAIG